MYFQIKGTQVVGGVPGRCWHPRHCPEPHSYCAEMGGNPCKCVAGYNPYKGKCYGMYINISSMLRLPGTDALKLDPSCTFPSITLLLDY